MRKFVNKHRQKRKYIKKSEIISSYQISKTAYRLLPILIMLIIFIATLSISIPLRVSLSHIKIWLPKFSLNSAIEYIKSFDSAFTQIYIIIGLIVRELLILITYISIILWYFFQQIINYFDLRLHVIFTGSYLIIFGNNLWQFLEFIFKEVTLLYENVINSLYLILAIIQIKFEIIILVISHFTVIIGQSIITSIFSVAQTFNSIVIIFVTYMIALFLAVAHAFLSIGIIVWTWLYAAIDSIFSAINIFLTSIFHIIKIPFSKLCIFYLQIKPYLNVLERHMQMTRGDFINSFINLNKLSSTLISTK
jgi:hypothetical protein